MAFIEKVKILIIHKVNNERDNYCQNFKLKAPEQMFT